jgi:hypothetical protein
MSSEHASQTTAANATSATSASAQEERREFFRVEDRAVLRYCPVPPEALEQIPPESHFDDSEVFWLMRELRTIDHENNNVLRGIAEHNRELGLYLKGLNRKLDLIANALADIDSSRRGLEPQAISVSEAGLSFVAESPLAVGTLLALELVLLPEHVALGLYGQVIANRDEDPARTVVAFTRLRESNRQILAKHILQVQIAARRRRPDD